MTLLLAGVPPHLRFPPLEALFEVQDLAQLLRHLFLAGDSRAVVVAQDLVDPRPAGGVQKRHLLGDHQRHGTGHGGLCALSGDVDVFVVVLFPAEDSEHGGRVASGFMGEVAEGSVQTVAVVDAVGSEIVVWHVQLAPSSSGDRMSGAWLVDADAVDAADTVRNITAGCAVLQVSDELPQVVLDAVGPHRVDVPATVAGVRDEVSVLKARAEEEKSQPGKASLTMPRFPAVSEVEAVEFPHVGKQASAGALAWARGIEELTETWAEIDSQRRRRRYLQGSAGAQPQPLPIVLKNA